MFRKFLKHKDQISGQGTDLRVALSERVYAIGDIHGQFDLLNAMLEAISKDISRFSDGRKPRIVFMGDYLDRGDHSREVIEALSEIADVRDKIKTEIGAKIDFLAGNHEVAMLSFLKDPVLGRAWLSWGGKQTLASFGLQLRSKNPQDFELIAIGDQLEAKLKPHLPFLKNLSKLVVSGKVVFVHAGLDPTFSLEDQPDAATFWGQISSGQKKPGIDGYRMVHGHYANYEPVTTPNRICVDTGAYYSGRLTSVRLDGGEAFLHVDAADLMD